MQSICAVAVITLRMSSYWLPVITASVTAATVVAGAGISNYTGGLSMKRIAVLGLLLLCMLLTACGSAQPSQEPTNESQSPNVTYSHHPDIHHSSS